jgi:hypothetical protein
MQEGRGGRNPFSGFPHPFGGRGFMPGFFGGRDPFDDPFFTQPFGGGMFQSNFFASAGNSFPGMHPTEFIEHHRPPPHPREPRRTGPVIEELNSDDEEEADKQKKENNRKHGRSSKQPYVEDPDEQVEERRSKKHLQYMNNPSRVNDMQPHTHNMNNPNRINDIQLQLQPHTQNMNNPSRVNDMQPRHQGHSLTFQSSTVLYGGANGACYTSSNIRRTGTDGVTFEESKEADIASGQASHRISRALHRKGHSLERKLNSDGRVDSRETLHNLNQDELAGFEEVWNGKARKHLPGRTGSFGGQHNVGINSIGQNAQASRGVLALPSIDSTHPTSTVRPDPSEKAVSSRSGITKKSVDIRKRSRMGQED